MSDSLSIRLPAWHIVAFDGRPMFRALAWALKDARLHGVGFSITSADRRDSVIKAFNKQHGTDLHSQQYLYDHQGEPGFYPANPPGFSSHELRSDGSPFFKVPRGASIPDYELGIDAVDEGASNSCVKLVWWLNSHGYKAARPYASGSEAHHFCFAKSPAVNARKRLAAYYLHLPHHR